MGCTEERDWETWMEGTLSRASLRVWMGSMLRERRSQSLTVASYDPDACR